MAEQSSSADGARDTEEVNIALAAAIGRPRTVLDAGCGSGQNGAVARLRGAHVAGVDADPAAAARARRLLDEVHECDATDEAAVGRALGDRRFDLVLAPDLVDGARDPAAVVRSLARRVAPEGHLVVSARNRHAWVRRNGRAARSPGRDELVRMVEEAGLEVLRVEHNPALGRAAREAAAARGWVAPPPSRAPSDAVRDLPVYAFYRAFVRPVEAAIAGAAPGALAWQNVVVARSRPKPGPLSLTVGMLTMNEEDSIARMMDEIRAVAPDAEIVCVDSSLKDQTPVIAERMGARVLRQLPPRGHGPAMEVLMYEAARRTDALVYLDCDFTYPPAFIPEVRRVLESGADVVNAARTWRRPEAMPMPNYVANRTFAACARLLHGVPTCDLHSGMRGYRTSVVRAFDFCGEGDALPIDTLLWPARCGYRVVEVGIDYQERVGYSKLRKVAGTVWTFVRLGKTFGVGRRRADTFEVRLPRR